MSDFRLGLLEALLVVVEGRLLVQVLGLVVHEDRGRDHLLTVVWLHGHLVLQESLAVDALENSLLVVELREIHKPLIRRRYDHVLDRKHLRGHAVRSLAESQEVPALLLQL